MVNVNAQTIWDKADVVATAPARAHALAANRTAVLERSLDIGSFLLLAYPVTDALSVSPSS
jgi:hypothetical protein